VSGIFAAEGGYQEFVLKGGEWAVLWLSAAAAILAIAVGFFLVRSVMAADEGTPKMKEIALAIQEGAWAYLKRQFKTIGVILIPLAIIVFVTSTAILKGDKTEALSFVQAGIWRTVAFILGCLASGLTGYIGMTLATRGNVRTAAAALTNSMPKALTVAFRTGGVAGMFTVGLGLIGATAIIMVFQNTSSVMLVGFGFGGSLLALFLRVGGGIFTKAADVGADLVGKVEAGIPEDDPRNPATIADNVGDNVGDCAGMAADLFESYEVTLVASIILGVAAFNSIGLNPAMGLVFPLAARAIGVIASIAGVFAVKAKEGETDALKPINKGFLVAGSLTLIGTLALALSYVGNKATTLSDAVVKEKGIDVMTGAGWRVFGAVAIGLVLAQLVSRLTEYYTATHHAPVKEIAESAETGPATAILSGTAYGLESSVYAVVAIAVAIGVALGLGGGTSFLKTPSVRYPTTLQVLQKCRASSTVNQSASWSALTQWVTPPRLSQRASQSVLQLLLQLHCLHRSLKPLVRNSALKPRALPMVCSRQKNWPSTSPTRRSSLVFSSVVQCHSCSPHFLFAP